MQGHRSVSCCCQPRPQSSCSACYQRALWRQSLLYMCMAHSPPGLSLMPAAPSTQRCSWSCRRSACPARTMELGAAMMAGTASAGLRAGVHGTRAGLRMCASPSRQAAPGQSAAGSCRRRHQGGCGVSRACAHVPAATADVPTSTHAGPHSGGDLLLAASMYLS